MDEKKGNKTAEYLRISLALRDLYALNDVIGEYYKESYLQKAIDYLEERRIKVG